VSPEQLVVQLLRAYQVLQFFEAGERTKPELLGREIDPFEQPM